jgi:hypothetical protein
LEVFAFDGKKLKYVAKRLKALRPLRGQVLGGKLLVVQHVATGLAVACQADADGECADNPLVAGAVAQVRQDTGSRPRLWVGDRLFCDLNQIPLLTDQGDHVLVRYQAKVSFHADPARPARSGTDSRGVPYTQEWGWLGAAGSTRRQYVRRITLRRPGEPIILVTDLPDEAAYPAADLLEVYLRRWGIEKLFLHVTQVFDLRHLIGGSPQATVFQAAFCLLLANVIQVVRCYIAEAQRRGPQTLSVQILFEDITEELAAWQKLVELPQTEQWLSGGVETVGQLQAYLRERLAGCWSKRWQKAATRPRAAKELFQKSLCSTLQQIWASRR